MTYQSPFATMRGMDILLFLRDSVADEAERKRTFIQQCEAVAGGTTSPEERQRVCALKSIADGLTYIVAIGQDEMDRCKKDRFREFPEWITRLANQSRGALIDHHYSDEEDLATG
jgi:hypothetical protein